MGKEALYYGTGRRKKSVARVFLYPGTGVVTINGRSLDDYFKEKTLEVMVSEPFEAVGATGRYDVVATVHGGGRSGQAGALRHGIARALTGEDEEYRMALKRTGLLTRDPRMKERRKYGLKKARKAPQFSKR